MKTSELTGAALDWAVAKATQMPLYQCGEGWPGNRVVNEESLRRPIVTVGLTGRMLLEGPKTSENKEWSPSTDWAQGGPIIEREEITIKHMAPSSKEMRWQAFPSLTAKGAGGKWACGPTPLVAAMRCYVATRFGEEIDVPQELL